MEPRSLKRGNGAIVKPNNNPYFADKMRAVANVRCDTPRFLFDLLIISFSMCDLRIASGGRTARIGEALAAFRLFRSYDYGDPV
jgi:hypothetical protein